MSGFGGYLPAFSSTESDLQTSLGSALDAICRVAARARDARRLGRLYAALAWAIWIGLIF